jgi:hypothetical protein
MHYPATGVGHLFAQGLIDMFYGYSILENFKGILTLAYYSIIKTKGDRESDQVWHTVEGK